MGKAEDWQAKVEKSFKAKKYKNIAILNPRRDDWDSSWVQSIDNKQFREQVEWELEGIGKSDAILVYFDETSKAPITLLELGIISKQFNFAIVVCPDEFYRKGNVDIVCKKYGIKQAESLEVAIKVIKFYLT